MSNPSRATSGPGTNSSISTRSRSGSRRCATSGERSRAATRRKAERRPPASSARITPRLPESTSGFTTLGYGARWSSASRSVPESSRGTTSKRGTGTPAWRRRARLNALLRAAATASDGLCGSRSLAAASAATCAVRSSTPTTASGLLSRTPRASSSAAVCADATNQVDLDDRYVSRFHCRLIPQGGRWVLKDLSSTNGTYLDGARVAEAEIEAGARIRVGSKELRVERAGPRLEASLPGLVACDPALGPVLELLRRAAPSSLPVILLGESGTGKEVAARAVHELSDRRAGPFVPLNCGAISRELAESELFGHERGSFTGAITSAP